MSTNINGRAHVPVEDQLRALPPLVGIYEHRELLCEVTGLSSPRGLQYMFQRDDLGVRPFKVGRRLMVRRSSLLRALGIPEQPPGWQLPQQGPRQQDIGELLLASPAPVVPGDGQSQPSQRRSGAAADEAARRWSEVLR